MRSRFFILLILLFLFIFQIFFLNNFTLFKYLNLALVFIFFFLIIDEFYLAFFSAVFGGLLSDFSFLFFRGFYTINFLILFFILYFLSRRINFKHLNGILFFSLLGIVFYRFLLFSTAYLSFFFKLSDYKPLISFREFVYFFISNLSLILILSFFYEKGFFKILVKRN